MRKPSKAITRMLAALALALTQVSMANSLLPPAASLTSTAQTVPNQYIVTLKKALPGDALAGLDVAQQAQRMLTAIGAGQPLYTYEYALLGFAAHLSPVQVQLLAAHPLVARISPDVKVKAIGVQDNATWGLDRIDQSSLPLDRRYNYPDQGGAGVHVYVIDTGLNPNHAEFTGRVGTGRNFVAPLLLGRTDPEAWGDCHGHGTHVAGTALGTQYGVAKKAIVHAVRVLDCQGSGSGAGILAGIDWVIRNHQAPAVANLSLGTVGGRSSEQESAVRALVDAGVAVAVAGGNDNASACSTSPAAEPAVLTVGATESADGRASYSNWGSCLDLFAPGSSVASASSGNNSGTTTMSGTSMASPHVAGALALIRGQYPSLTSRAAQDQVVAMTLAGKISNVGTGSPNKLLQVAGGGGQSTDQPPVASFSHSCNGLSCGFSGSNSTDDKGLTRYAWTFGDGGQGSGVSVSRSYANAGTYNVTLTVTDTAGQTGQVTRSVTVGSSSGGGTTTGTLSPGANAYHPSANGFSSPGGNFHGVLRGPSNADFDLYLERYSRGLLGGSWSVVARAEGTSSNEEIRYSGAAGTYRWRVKAYSGSGSYTLTAQNP